MAALLTIWGLLGIGVTLWVKGQIDQTITKQKEEFEAARRGYEDRANQHLSIAAVLFTFQNRLFVDQLRFHQLAQEIRAKLSDANWKAVQSKAAIVDLFRSDLYQVHDLTKFTQQLDELKKLNKPERNDLFTVEIAQLQASAAHIRALDSAVQEIKSTLFHEAKADINTLITFYDKHIYPYYIKEYRKFSPYEHFAGAGQNDINTLSSDARMEFDFYVPHPLFRETEEN